MSNHGLALSRSVNDWDTEIMRYHSSAECESVPNFSLHFIRRKGAVYAAKIPCPR